MHVFNQIRPRAAGRKRAAALLGLAAAMGLSACDTMVVTAPLAPTARVVYRLPPLATCVPADARVQARILTQLQGQFRGPLRGNGRRVTWREHMRRHSARVYDCGTVWRITFTPIGVVTTLTRHDYVLRKDGVVVYFPFG